MTTRLTASIRVAFIGFTLAAIGLSISTAVLHAQASFVVRHSFTGTNGKFPQAPLIQGSDGLIYGTTSQGGANNLGTIFRMASNGSVTVLHSFAGAADGFTDHVATLLQAPDGSFYGTTDAHTGHGGQIFQMTSAGAVTILHPFVDNTNAPDGYSPKAPLILAADGNMYGTTALGGVPHNGTIFKMTPGGTFTKLYEFPGGAGGSYPTAALLQAGDGNFYGTTQYGGASDGGTIFRMTPAGTVTILHQFVSSTARPIGALIQATDGDFYGTTMFGGTGNGGTGNGTIFRMTLGGTVTVVHELNGTTDGAFPQGALTQAADGNFYGTVRSGAGATLFGGIFKTSSDGAYTLLHAFAVTSGAPEGFSSSAPLILATDGFLYGTNRQGGANGFGVVFRMGVSTDPTNPPVVVTGVATAIGSSSATLNGTANPNGASTTASFQYGLTTGYGGTTPGQALGSGNGAVTIGGGAIAGLACNTQYHFRAVATNAGGTTQGSDATFTTSACPPPPTTVTGAATAIGRLGATLNGTANPNGTSTTASFQYGLTTSYGGTTPVQALGSGSGAVTIGGGAITGLTCNTQYHFRAVATNASGTANGSDATFITRPCSTAAGDFDGDAKGDLLLRNKSTGQNIGWLMNGATVSTSAFMPTIADTNWEIRGRGDFDGDGKADVIWRNNSTGQDIGWLMNGLTVATSAFMPTIADTNWEIRGIGDFDGDGKADVILRNKSTGQDIGWLMNGLTVSTSAFMPTIADTNWEIVGVGDFNGDGKADVLLRNKSTGQNIGWLMNGLTVSTSAFLPTIADTNWEIKGVGDLDGDGKADVILRNKSTGQDIGWLMNGLTVSTSALMPTIADTNWDIEGAGDFDGDGKADVVLRNKSTGQNIQWLMNGLTVSSSAFLPTIADTNWELVGQGQ